MFRLFLFGPRTKPLLDFSALVYSLSCSSQFGLEVFFFFTSSQQHSNGENRLIWGLTKLAFKRVSKLRYTHTQLQKKKVLFTQRIL